MVNKPVSSWYFTVLLTREIWTRENTIVEKKVEQRHKNKSMWRNGKDIERKVCVPQTASRSSHDEKQIWIRFISEPTPGQQKSWGQTAFGSLIWGLSNHSKITLPLPRTAARSSPDVAGCSTAAHLFPNSTKMGLLYKYIHTQLYIYNAMSRTSPAAKQRSAVGWCFLRAVPVQRSCDPCLDIMHILFLSPEPHKFNNLFHNFCVEQAHSTQKPTCLPAGFI